MSTVVRDVPIPEILRRVTASCDWGWLETPGDWRYSMAEKLEDGPIIGLINSMRLIGQLRPIYIVEYPNGEWELGNGHHRLTSAILLGWDTISALVEGREDRPRSGGWCPPGSGSEDDVFLHSDWSEAFELAEMLRAA